MTDKNSFYRSELRALFIKYNVEQNVELINFLAQLIGSKDRAAQGVYEAVNEFVALSQEHEFESFNFGDLLPLQQKVYGIVWQSSLEK